MVGQNKTYMSLACSLGTTEFQFDFYVTAKTDIACFHLSTIGEITDLSNPTDFSVDSPDLKAGGTVTLVSAFIDGTLFIYRATDKLQSSVVINNTKTPEQTFEYMVDKNTIMIQELWERVQSCIRGPVGETKDMELAHYLLRAGYLRFDPLTRELTIVNSIEGVLASALGASFVAKETPAEMRTVLEVLKDDHVHDDRYFTETEIGSSITTDLATIGVIKTQKYHIDETNHTILYTDDYSFYEITTGAADRTIILPALADSLGKEYGFFKIDTGIGEAIIDAAGAETIVGFLITYLINQYDYVFLKASLAFWMVTAGNFQPVSGEPSGGTWHKYKNPGTGNFVSKISGWVVDSFSGGLEVDFGVAGVKRAGMKAVRVVVRQTATNSFVYSRKKGDTNVSNTPNASAEYSHRLMALTEDIAVSEIWLSTDCKAEFAVTDTGTDLYLYYPIEYSL